MLGPNKIPGVARALGKAYSEFRRTMNEANRPVKEFTKEITAEINDVKRDVNIDKQGIISDLNSTADDFTKDVQANGTEPAKKPDVAS